MTVWQSAGLWFGLVVYAVAWLRGGHPERLGAGLLLLTNLSAELANAWEVGAYRPGFMIMDAASLLIFGGLWFRSNRWWPAVAASGYGLIVLVQAIRVMDPTFSHYAMVSAKVGLWYVVDLALLFGVWERWLAGEAPAARAAWAKATRFPTPRASSR